MTTIPAGTRFTDRDPHRNPRALNFVIAIQPPEHRVRKPVAVCVSSNGKVVNVALERLLNPVRFTRTDVEAGAE